MQETATIEETAKQPTSKIYIEIARALLARALRTINQKTTVTSHVEMAEKRLQILMDTAPSGSGIDCGTKLDDNSTHEKLIFNADFHHMDENGYYDGWTEHKVIVKPCFMFGLDIRITGSDRNAIKDYLHDVYHTWLTSDIEISKLYQLE